MLFTITIERWNNSSSTSCLVIFFLFKFLKEVFSPISTKTLELDQIIEVCDSYLIIYSIICLFTKKGNSKSSLIRTSKKKCKSSSCTSLTKINHKSKNSFEIDQFLTYACKKWIFTMYLRVSAINYILFDMIICIQHSMLTSLFWSCSFFY